MWSGLGQECGLGEKFLSWVKIFLKPCKRERALRNLGPFGKVGPVPSRSPQCLASKRFFGLRQVKVFSVRAKGRVSSQVHAGSSIRPDKISSARSLMILEPHQNLKIPENDENFRVDHIQSSPKSVYQICCLQTP